MTRTSTWTESWDKSFKHYQKLDKMTGGIKKKRTNSSSTDKFNVMEKKRDKALSPFPVHSQSPPKEERNDKF